MKRKIKSFLPSILAGVLPLSFAVVKTNGAVDAFLRFREPNTAVQGESLDQTFTGAQGWFEINDWETGFGKSVTLGVDPSLGRISFREYSFAKRADKASPGIFGATVKGTEFGYAELALRQSGGGEIAKAPFYTALFKQAYVTSVDWDASTGDDNTNERVKLLYGEIQWSFTRFDSKGAPISTFTVNWNQITNRGDVDGTVEPPPPNTIPVLSYASPHTVVSGGSLTISPASGPSDPEGIFQTVVKTKVGYTGGISVGNLNGVVSITGANPVGGPYTIVIETEDNQGLKKEASFQLTVTAVIPPFVANTDSLTRGLARGFKFSASTLVANDSAGAVFDGLLSDTTALGGRVTLADSTIIYDPPVPDPGSTDSFTYRVRNAEGQTATGTVNVTVGGPNGGPSGNLIIRVGDEGTDLELAGIPGRSYQLQRAASVEGPWMNLGDAVPADANGSAKWTDPDLSAPRFYRAYNTP